MIVPRQRLHVSIPSPPPSPHPRESRAPPPSPCDESADDDGGGAGPQFDAYLRHATVPNLVLSGAVYRRRMLTSQPGAEDPPPAIDMAELMSSSCGYADSAAAVAIKAAARSLGCFQLTNHGVSSNEAFMVASAAAALVAGRKCSVWKTQVEVEDHDADDADDSDDDTVYRWSRGRGRVLETVAGRRGKGPCDTELSSKMDALWSEMERVAGEVMQILQPVPERCSAIVALQDDSSSVPRSPSTLCFHSHKSHIPTTASGDVNSSSSSSSGTWPSHGDVIRMLVQGSRAVSGGGRRRNSLCLHFCCGAAGFQMYSRKRGWSSFRPNVGSIVVTVGEQLQACSGGLYRQAVAKPIFRPTDEEDGLECPSRSGWVSFHYNHSHPVSGPGVTESSSGEKVISLLDQLIIAACLVLLYHFVAAWLG